VSVHIPRHKNQDGAYDVANASLSAVRFSG
jgi:hypothetical protein